MKIFYKNINNKNNYYDLIFDKILFAYYNLILDEIFYISKNEK